MVDILYKGKFYPNESPFKSCHACHSISKRNWIYMKSLAAEVLPNRNQHFHDFFLTSTFSFQLKWGNWTPTCSKKWKNDMPHLNRWNQSEYQMFIHTPKKKSVHIPLLCICCTKLQQIKIWLCIHTSYYIIESNDRIEHGRVWALLNTPAIGTCLLLTWFPNIFGVVAIQHILAHVPWTVIWRAKITQQKRMYVSWIHIRTHTHKACIYVTIFNIQKHTIHNREGECKCLETHINQNTFPGGTWRIYGNHNRLGSGYVKYQIHNMCWGR